MSLPHGARLIRRGLSSLYLSLTPTYSPLLASFAFSSPTTAFSSLASSSTSTTSSSNTFSTSSSSSFSSFFSSSSSSSSSSSAAPLWGNGSRCLQVVDAHAGGEPARVVVGGLPPVEGLTMMDKRQSMMQHHDHIRELLLLEPRGYPCQNANLLFPSSHPDADYGVVILEQNKVYPAMSGHNFMCVVTVLLETGMVPMVEGETSFCLEAPGGLVQVRAQCEHGKVVQVTLRNLPSFVEHLSVPVSVPQLGLEINDVAFGGMWYCIAHAKDAGLSIEPSQGKQLTRVGEMLKVACREQYPVQHPSIDYPGCDILCWREGSKNTVVMSNGTLDWDREETWGGMLDRSPCGTGTSAVMASMWARGELGLGEVFEHESIVGSVFKGELVEETVVEGKRAVVPEISGRAWLTQHCTVVVDPSDPFPRGYTVGDIWA